MDQQRVESSDTSFRDRLRSDLTAALRSGDKPRTSALRSALAAIENAAAVDIETRAEGVAGYGDVPRRRLSRRDLLTVMSAEIEEREVAVDQYRSAGRPLEADVLEDEIAVLRSYHGDL